MAGVLKEVLAKGGIFAQGFVVEKTSYTGRDGNPRYQLRVFIPGADVITLGLPEKPRDDEYNVGDPFKGKLTVGEYNGRTFFNMDSK